MSDNTRQSRALKEEIVYGIDALELPVIVTYPNIDFVGHGTGLSNKAVDLWDNLPAFRDRIEKVPTAHIPFKKEFFSKALADSRFSVVTKTENCCVGFNSEHEQRIQEIKDELFSRIG